MFLLDTPVLSELEKPQPNPGVVEWLASVDWIDLHLSAVTVAEIWQGIVRLPAGKKRRALEAFFGLLPDQFAGRILPVDFQVGIRYGEIQAKLGPLPVLDTLIGATALVNHLTVITRNTGDIARTSARVHDPWT
jgi:predicted nucleic acid-binding protein